MAEKNNKSSTQGVKKKAAKKKAAAKKPRKKAKKKATSEKTNKKTTTAKAKTQTKATKATTVAKEGNFETEDQQSAVAKLVYRAKYDNDEEAFAILYSKLSNYFDFISMKFFIDGFDKSDIHQECMIALKWKAIADFDAKKGSFIRFAKLCIKRHIITKLKQMKKKKYQPLNEALSIDKTFETNEDFGPNSIASMLSTPHSESIDKSVAKAEYYNFIISELNERLTKLERIVLELYFEGNSYKEIVKAMNHVPGFKNANVKVVDNALERIKRKARTLLDGIEKDKFNRKT